MSTALVYAAQASGDDAIAVVLVLGFFGLIFLGTLAALTPVLLRRMREHKRQAWQDAQRYPMNMPPTGPPPPGWTPQGPPPGWGQSGPPPAGSGPTGAPQPGWGPPPTAARPAAAPGTAASSPYPNAAGGPSQPEGGGWARQLRRPTIIRLFLALGCVILPFVVLLVPPSWVGDPNKLLLFMLPLALLGIVVYLSPMMLSAPRRHRMLVKELNGSLYVNINLTLYRVPEDEVVRIGATKGYRATQKWYRQRTAYLRFDRTPGYQESKES